MGLRLDSLGRHHDDLYFEAGDSFTLAWVGFEGCCGGSSTLRFSIDGGGYIPFTSPNIDPVLVPEPSTALLLAIGLACLAVDGTRRKKCRSDPCRRDSSSLPYRDDPR